MGCHHCKAAKVPDHVSNNSENRKNSNSLQNTSNDQHKQKYNFLESTCPALDSLLRRVVESIQKAQSMNISEMVVFLGNTGSGKSTTINFLQGRAFVSSSTGASRTPDVMSSTTVKSSGPEIGHGEESKTLEPCLFEICGLGLVCDLPGFEDTRSPEVSIGNAVCISCLLNGAQRLKFCICVKYASLFDRGTSLKLTIKHLEKLFVSRDALLKFSNSIIVAITSAPDTKEQFIRCRVQEILQSIDSALTVLGQNLVLICPYDGLISPPTKDATSQPYHIKEEFSRERVIRAIKNLQVLQTNNFSFQVSLSSDDLKHFLRLQEDVETYFVALFRQHNYAEAHRFFQELANIDPIILKCNLVQLLLQESLVCHVKNTSSKLRQDFFSFCLPGSHFKEDAAQTVLCQIENLSNVFGSNILEDFTLVSEIEDLRIHLQKSQIANGIYCKTQKNEEHVVKAELELRDFLELKSKTYGFENLNIFQDAFGCLQLKVKEEIEKLDDKSAQDRHNFYLSGCVKCFEQAKLQIESKERSSAKTKQQARQICQLTARVFLPESSSVLCDYDAKIQASLKNTKCLVERLNFINAWIGYGQNLGKQTSGNNMIMFIGNSGVGKSTLINALCGCTMVKKTDGTIHAEPEIASIGHGATSTTNFIKIYQDNTGDHSVYGDCSGFNDSRGLEMRIVNACSLQSAFNSAQQAKVVIVISAHAFSSERGKGVRDLENVCLSLFGGSENLIKHSSSVLIGISHACEVPGLESYKRAFSSSRILSNLRNIVIVDPTKIDFRQRFLQLTEKLTWMQKNDQSIFKIALSPNEMEDILTLLSDVIKEISLCLAKAEIDWNEILSYINPFIYILKAVSDDSLKCIQNLLNTKVTALLVPYMEKINNLFMQSGTTTAEFEAAKKFLEALKIVDTTAHSRYCTLFDQMEQEAKFQKVHAEIQKNWVEQYLAEQGDTVNAQALASFYSATRGYEWKNSTNWLSGHPLSQWHGITVGQNDTIISICLPSNNLRGILLEKVFYDLRNLTELDLTGNTLFGELPISLGSLTNLQVLKLDGNLNLCGPCPALQPNTSISLERTGIGTTGEIVINYSSFPFYTVCVEIFLSLNGFVPHEKAQEIPGLLVHMSIGEIQFESFRCSESNAQVNRDSIMFCSHRWLEASNGHPDDAAGTKFNQLKSLLRKRCFRNIKYFWIDYFCIPQHKSAEGMERQQRAINSIGYYVRCSSKFVTLVGNSGQATIDVYNTRGWCQYERFASVTSPKECASYIHNKDDDTLQENSYFNEELNPYKGNFCDPKDKERLAPSLVAMCVSVVQSRSEHSNGELTSCEMLALNILKTAELSSFLSSEAVALLSSGSWEGWYEQYGEKNAMLFTRFELEYNEDSDCIQVVGSGSDVVGPFTITGQAAKPVGEIQFIKKYPAHSIHYHGTLRSFQLCDGFWGFRADHNGGEFEIRFAGGVQ